MYKLTLIITSTLKRAWYAILIAILSMALLFSSLVLGAGQESHPAVNLASTPIAISAQGYPNGQRPFLIRKPFRESYQNSLWVNSFFDHKLPVQLEFEGNPHIPADLQDVTHVINFLNESEFGVRTDCVLGLSCYSGHEGIDYNTGYQEIIAPANGIIRIGSESYIGTGVNRKQNNCHIWIDHDASNPGGIAYNFSTHYLHLSRIGDASANALAQPRRMSANREWVSGDKIRAGETIGISGNDPCGGSGTGAHLHFGVAAGAANERGNSRIFDPFGWWYNGADSWNDDRLNNPSIPISARPTRSLWAWAAPQNPGTGNPGYWGEGILAQTDDTDTSFQKFGLSTRREGANGWNSILSNSIPGIQPIGTGAWWSKSPTQDTNKNWAIWGLHVPADGQYRIQAHFPKLPQGINATTNARYTLHIPTSDTAYDIWTSSPINQQANNQWRYIGKDANNTMLSLRANTVVLVMLSDFTGTSGEAVIFDAIRLEAATPVQPPPPPPVTGRVAFAIDNSSSMQESGKISAVKTTLSTWVNELVTSGIQFNYALEPFANNTPPVQQTTNPDQIKSWINALSANDIIDPEN